MVGKEKPRGYFYRGHLRCRHHHHDRHGSPKCCKKRCKRHKQTRKDPWKDSREGRTRTWCAPEPRRGSFETGSKGCRVPFGKPLASGRHDRVRVV